MTFWPQWPQMTPSVYNERCIHIFHMCNMEEL